MSEAQPTGVILGAGNIGKGLVAELFQDAGLAVVFVDADPDVVAALSARPEYDLHLHGPDGGAVRRIRSFEIHAVGSAEAADALRRAAACATAVRPANLADVGRMLSPVCDQRAREPWNVLVCENDPHGAERVRAKLAGASGAMPGCVQCSVERMVAGSETDEDGLLHVHAEAFRPLIAEAGPWRGPRPEWPGLRFVDDVRVYFDRKKHTSNFGHAVLGYLGAAKGYRYVWQAAADAELARMLEALFGRIYAALAAEHDAWPPAELREHRRRLLEERYPSRALGDTVARVARDARRKLGPEERIVGTLKMLQRHGQPTDGFGTLIGAATLWALRDEPGRWLRPDMTASDVRHALAVTTGLGRSSPLIGEAMAFLTEMGDLR